jgi:hypothetical protein
MPGAWTQVSSICGSRRLIAYRTCNAWADEGSAQCRQWADEGSNQCRDWADQGSNQCTQWADEGSKQCCDWAPCSWFCDFFYWVAKWVCLGWYWVAKWVCLAWYWVAKWVCLAWYWVARWVCLAWTWLFYLFCLGGNGGPMFLLTDGTVLMNECANGYGTRRWWKLTPDITGSYVNGLWTRVADSNYGRKYFASALLADGTLLVSGGEYSDVSGSNTQDDTAKTEIYDPLADTWTEIAGPPGVTQVGDSACSLLPDGTFLLGNFNSQTVSIFDPTAGTWTSAANKGDSGSEETWVLLREGTVVTPQCTNAPNAEKYVVANDQWVSAGTLAANIVETASLELGPGILLNDGRAFFVGANAGRTALYTPGAMATAAGTWVAGPSIPTTRRGQAQGSKDGPGSMLPSGTVLFPAAPVDGSRGNYLSPCSFFEFDGVNLARVADPPNANCPTYVGRMLLLPNGQVLWAREDDQGIYAYTETAALDPAARPVITAHPNLLQPGTKVTISGRQFNGLSQAVGYGDDYAAATNYPLVRIRNPTTGQIRYCRTSGHTTVVGGATVSSMGVATGAAIISTQVSVPAVVGLGSAELVVVANGVPSDAVKVRIGRGRG